MIDGIRIECEEDGFYLVLEGDFIEAIERYTRSNIDEPLSLHLPQSSAIQLNAQVRGVISPWVDEMNSARREFDASRGHVDERESLALDDPKHPDYRERLAEMGDAARDRADG